MIQTSKLSCMDTDHVDYIEPPWIIIRSIVYFGTIAITGAISYIYWSSGVPFCCCPHRWCRPCCAKNTELCLMSEEIYMKGFVLDQEASEAAVFEQFVMYPFFFLSFLLHILMTMSRLSGRVNE